MGFVDWLLLGAYFALLIVIGVQTIKRVKSSDDFAVAGNRIIWPVFFGSLAASFLGGGASLGVAGKTFSDGYVYMFAFFGYALSFLLVGLFVAPRLKRYLGAHTVGDVMEHHYGRSSRLITGVLSIALCAGILGAQALAIGTVVNATLDLRSGRRSSSAWASSCCIRPSAGRGRSSRPTCCSSCSSACSSPSPWCWRSARSAGRPS